MATDIKNLDNVAGDPLSQHTLVIDMIEADGTYQLNDPTSPYVKLLEATSVTSASVVGEVIKSDKRIFPSLAQTAEDIYPHIVGEDELNLFATPAYTSLRFYISMDSIKLHGRVSATEYQVVIPANTYIEVAGLTLTLMTDLKIRITETDGIYRSFVERDIGDFESQESDIGNLISSVTADGNGTPWLTFEAPVKQVTVVWLESIATKGLNFEVRVPLEGNQYFASDVYLKDGLVLDKVFTDEYYDPTKPSVVIKVLDNEVIYIIPRAFIDSGLVNGVINIIMYSTKGKMHQPLSIYGADDFQINVFSSNQTGAHTAARNLDYFIVSNKAVTGGVDKRLLKDIKAKVINRATGSLQVPITEFHLKERFKFLGLAIYKAMDTILDRLYIVSKDSFQQTEENLKSLMYTFCNSYNLISSDLNDHSLTALNSTYTMFKPGAVFTNDDEAIRAVSDTELAAIEALPIDDRIVYLNKNQLLFTPFLYIIDNKQLDVKSRVYDIDNPNVDYRRIIQKNESTDINVNIVWTKMVRTNDSFILILKLFGNELFDLANDVNATIVMDGKDKKLSFSSFKDPILAQEYVEDIEPADYNKYEFIVFNTDNYIDRNNNIRIYGVNGQAYEEYIPISSEIEIIIAQQSSTVLATTGTPSQFLTVEEKSLITNTASVDVLGLTREKMVLTFAVELEYLWRYITPSYNDRKYERYGYDVPLTYTEDVFAVLDDGKTYSVIDGNIVYNIIHRKGDVVIDADGNTVYKHRAGDVVLDSKGNPIPNGEYGINRLLDMIMLEYNYKAFEKPKYLSYIKRHVKDIVDLVTDTLVDENKILLEQTMAIYRPLRSNAQINDNVSNVLSPLVELYFKSDTTITLDETTLYNEIGEVLNRYLSKRYIVMDDLERAIETIVGSGLLSAKVSGCVEGDPKIIYLDDSGQFRNRYTLAKVIDKSLDITYSYEMKIVKI